MSNNITPHQNVFHRISGFVKQSIKFALEFSIIRFLRYIKYRVNVDDRASPANLYKIIRERAAISSADFVEQKLDASLLFSRRELLWDFAMSKTRGEGLFAEFGVYTGYSINYFARKLSMQQAKIFGFDSFEGLKEDWYGTGLPIGAFEVGGQLPNVLNNVTLIKGWFDSTVPRFLEEHSEKFSFVHLDADTYESTLLVLNLIKDRIAEGTVVIFDEYLGFPNWQNGEFLAWQQFSNNQKLQYKYLGFSTQQAAIQVL